MVGLKKEKKEKRSGTCCNKDIWVLQKGQQRCALLTLQNKSLGLGKAKWHPFLQCFTLILTSACVLEGCRTSNWTAVERSQCCNTPAEGHGWQNREGAGADPENVLTSIKQSQGCQHQERRALPHKLIHDTPKGGAHCQGKERTQLWGLWLWTNPLRASGHCATGTEQPKIQPENPHKDPWSWQ